MINKKWNKILDTYLITKHMLSEEYESLTFEQKFVIQEIKKNYRRFSDKSKKIKFDKKE